MTLAEQVAQGLTNDVLRDVLNIYGRNVKPDAFDEMRAVLVAAVVPVIRELQREAIRDELRQIAAWIREPGHVWAEDAIDECARVLENRAVSIVKGDEPVRLDLASVNEELCAQNAPGWSRLMKRLKDGLEQP